MTAARVHAADIIDEVAYVYDGTLEGLLNAVFEAYALREHPSDVAPEGILQPRLAQRIHSVVADAGRAERVRRGVVERCGERTFFRIVRAAASSDADAGSAVYRFIRYAMDVHRGKGRAISNIAHPAVSRLFELDRSVCNECEKMRQFARFEHLAGDGVQVWFAKVNPRDAVVPLVLGHFVERFSIQPFIIFDEVHDMAGVWDGERRYLVRTGGADLLGSLPQRSAAEVAMQDAWRTFYRAVAIDARYNPELRRQFMPMRFWKNITELRDGEPALRRA